MDETLTNMLSQLAVLATSEMTTGMHGVFTANRKKKDITEICNSYEEVINKLIRERSELVVIAQSLESELNRYKISEEDIEHLQRTLESILDVISSFSSNKDDTMKIKSLISVDVIKALQLLGFDYKAAIGEPLTRICADTIEQKLQVQRHKSNNQNHKTKR